MKKIIILLICLSSGIIGHTQLSEAQAGDALAKYWLYKWRFLNDFIKVGDQKGESLPVAERSAMGERIFRFGDGAQKLGMYINLLATEYKLLYDNERWVDLEKTKTELYYAIEAYRRLDCTAEWYRPYYKDPDFDWCNGYFMRGDVDIDFLDQPAKPWDASNTQTNKDLLNQSYTDFCYDIDPNIYSGPVDELRLFVDPSGDQNCSEFAVQEYNPDASADLVNEESQDQFFCILQGLGMVIKLIPAGLQSVTLNNGVQILYDFNTESRDLLLEMIYYAKKETTVIYNLTYYDNTSDWLISNPNNELVDRGAGIFQFSFPVAVIGNQFFNPPNNLHDWMTFAFRGFWNAQHINLSGNGNTGDLNTSMQCQLAAMSNAWYSNIGPFGINITPYSLLAKAEDHDWDAFYLPLWSIWNNLNIPIIMKNYVFDEIYDDINSAPCEGPFRFATSPTSAIFPQQWAGVFKYFKELEVTHNGNGPYISGFYNGNDYMLLHNFHYLISDDPLPFFHNLIDRIIDYDVPGVTYTQNSSPYNLNAFNTITANSTVESGNEVVYRAGYEITLKPGFHAEAGANFHAFIDPFTCVNGEYRSQNTDSTLATAYGFNEKFNFTNHGIIDYSKDATEEITQNTEEKIDLKSLLMVYPNPCTDKFTYLVSDQTELNKMQQIELYNMIGELVQTENINYNGQNILDITHLPTGIYVVKVISGERVYSAKIMVEE